MTKNISNTLDIEKVTSALAKRLPEKKKDPGVMKKHYLVNLIQLLF